MRTMLTGPFKGLSTLPLSVIIVGFRKFGKPMYLWDGDSREVLFAGLLPTRN